MRFFAELWMTVSVVYSILFYVGVVGALIVLERHFISERSKGEYLLPIACVVLAIVFSVFSFQQKTLGSGRLGYQQVMVDNMTVGIVQVVTDDNYQLQGFGKYITNEGAASDFIDLTIDERGKIKSSSRPLPDAVKMDIEENFSYFKSIKAGSSQSYTDLMELDAEVNQIQKRLSLGSFLYGFAWCGIPVCIIAGIYLSSVFRRKKRRAFDKTRLEDL